MRQNVQKELWESFRSRFKSKTTEASYWSDINEFCTFCDKKFEELCESDVKKYYEMMQKRIAEGKVSPLTVTKKFRELHSFARFLEEQEECAVCRDYFYLYLKHLEKEKNLARSVPVEDMDRLFRAASEDIMAYTILTLMYRAGFSSTEIISLNGPDDLVFYGDDAYALISGRREPVYIPEDAWKILMRYMDQREVYPSLFYNRSGRRLNTMYISRMMKKYCQKAGIESYSAEAVRNCCAFNLFAYGASAGQVAGQMGRTEQQIRRYRGVSYRGNLGRRADTLVKIRIECP